MHLDTKGLVLRALDAAENDRVLSILTPEFGVLSAFANGAKRLRSSQLAAAQVLCYGEFSLYRRRDTYTVDDARAISVFFGLRDDISALALAQYFCELAAVLAPAETEAGEFLALVIFALTCLEKQRRPQEILKPSVELRMLSLAGYAPDLARCRVCNGDELYGDYVRLHPLDGNFSCSDCSGLHTPKSVQAEHSAPGNEIHSSGGETIGLGVLAAMRHIYGCPLNRLFSFMLSAPSLAVLGNICEEYLRLHVPRRWDTLEFYRQVAEAN
ncbi:MAG: DNA repair protein RecO [Oscillospiraceae bacterium]|nr:DNA repair protein RecO [Oscillospiraceae bacterium]